MNYERMGIYVTLAVMVGVLGIAGISSGEFAFELNEKDGIAGNQYTSSTSTEHSGFYEWCYQFERDCK